MNRVTEPFILQLLEISRDPMVCPSAFRQECLPSSEKADLDVKLTLTSNAVQSAGLCFEGCMQIPDKVHKEESGHSCPTRETRKFRGS